MNHITYTIIILFIVLGCMTPIQNAVASFFGFSSTNIVFNLVYALVLVGAFILIKYLLVDKNKKSKEDFFFEVNNNQKCGKVYKGKPTTFQYTQVGSGDCKPESFPPLGMIEDIHSCKNCLYGNAIQYPQGVSYQDPGRVPKLNDDTPIIYSNTDIVRVVPEAAPQSYVYPYADVGNRL
jgi:hypothetical protein